jgi:microcystin-dependent protein
MKLVYNTGTLSGFVRANGRTIGNATSGATERANADTSALFVFLYNADANLAVSGGRGANAAADYAANKTIALPDFRGRTIAGLDDMGNSAASRLSSTYFGTAATALGAAGGSESTTLTAAQIPSITSTVTTTTDLTSILSGSVANTNFLFGNSGSTQNGGLVTQFTLTSAARTSTGTGTSNNTSGNAHRTVQPTMLITVYMKL